MKKGLDDESKTGMGGDKSEFSGFLRGHNGTILSF